MKLLVTPRAWWHAAPPTKQLSTIEHPAKNVFFSYTGGIYGYTDKILHEDLIKLQKRHIKKEAADIIFNFLIGGQGQVFEGRGWHACPKLAGRFYKMAEKSISIGYMGIFKGTVPPSKMMRAGDWLVKLGVEKGFIDPHFLEIRITHCGMGWEMTPHIRNKWRI